MAAIEGGHGVGGNGNGPDQLQQGWRMGPWALLLALGIALAALLGGPVAPGAALSLPWRQPPSTSRSDAGLQAAGHLQEVPPPVAVQQLQQALADRLPSLEILTPTTNSLVPAGPWTLRVRLNDWPLVDGGELGLGPHLVVQLDSEPPRRLTSTEIAMPPLSPGSHRLTVFAARPWGEAVKSPGAYCQIRIHRAAANPLALPAPGTPQLIPVSPEGMVVGEPVLLDWLLLNAPLQHLRGADSAWRLRVSINGDSFLVDRQLPLWLKGLRSGSNAILLELVDGRGEPLNPPFNSVVSEVSVVSDVNLAPGQKRPRWLGARLEDDDQAILLGIRAAAPLPPTTTDQVPKKVLTSSPDDDAATSPSVPGTEGSAPVVTGSSEPVDDAGSSDRSSDPQDGEAVTEPLDGNSADGPSKLAPELDPPGPDPADKTTGLSAEPSADPPGPPAVFPYATPPLVSR